MEAFPIEAPAFSGESRRVPAGNAFEWLRDGWAVFAAAPGVWVVIALIVMIANFLLAIVPVLGQVASLILAPMIAAGALQVCRRSAEGGQPQISDLFWPFRQRTGPLATVGLLYMGGFALVVLMAAALVGGGALLGALFGGGTHGTAGALGGGAIAGLLAAVIAMLACVPLFMSVWFAPALVAFNDMPAAAAMRASFVACARNFAAITVFSIVFIVAGFFATLPAGLGWLLLLPVTFGALHASYRDVFPAA